MGSSSSTKTSSAKEPTPANASTPRTTRNAAGPKPLVGSSTPPKGPPRMAKNGVKSNGTSSSNRQTNNSSVKQVSNGTGDLKSATNGRKTTHNGTSIKDIQPKQQAVEKEPTAEKRVSVTAQSSKHRKSEVRKSLVRQMERGLEDAGNVDAILGLDRMRSKMILKRERTRIREEMLDVEIKRPLSRFKNASKQARGLLKLPPSSADEVYMGNANIDCPSRVKIVRIFTSSTFTDTMHERNTLMKDAYPKVKAFCQELGYDFQVVDMRWGIRDQATDDNMTTEICLTELEMCKKLSTGPYFVTLVSHKYGYADFPRCIPAREFETMLAQVTDPELQRLFKKWYNKDLNSVPPAYVVSPISAHLPDFLSAEKEKKDVAKKQWWTESEKIQTALEDIAAKVFDAPTARKYIRSVSETEIQSGLFHAKEPGQQCLWLKRTIEDISEQEPSYRLSRYTECTFNNSEEKVQKVKQMLNVLEAGMSKVLPSENTLQYSVKWNKEEGLNPDKDAAHASYLSTVSKDFVQAMCKMIKAAVDRKASTDDEAAEEILQHVQFCQEKCLSFHGRANLLKRAKDYLQGMSNEPLAFHAESGSGKTSVMAMIAKEAWKWTGQRATIILRFIGTTPTSSTLNGLLSSITSQIRRSYHVAGKVAQDLRSLVNEFESSLLLATSEHPLVLILDSLDMLDPSHNARQLQWLPARLRANIKIIVSTLPGTQYEAFPVLQTTIKTKENIVEITRLPDSDVSAIIDKWLAFKDRKLTGEQKSFVLKSFSKCPLPLYLKLAVDTASSWASYTPKSMAILESTVRASIDSLFQRLEKLHGYIFVSRALGYLSTARVGLTETELEDILSCDDDVLSDVYMYWTPPIRRLPPLLLIRLRTDLNQYLVDRGADNVRVVFWYHRQFLEAAQSRYCDSQETKQQLHAALANFFAGIWANGNEKPFTNSKGEKGQADRHVSSQPNKYGTAYNLRKLNNLPYHRCYARQLDKLKDQCLSNFEFLLDKLSATSLWNVMEDFALAQKAFPDDELLKNINDVLQLSQNGLLYDPNQLVCQLIGRLSLSKITEKFLKQCQEFPLPSLQADKRILTQPGGQLIHSMAGHKGDILSLDLASDSKLALTCSDDDTIRLWNVKSGKQVRVLDGLGKVTRATFCHNDEYILIVMNTKHSVRSVTTGEKLYDISTATDDSPSCATGAGKTQLIIFKDNKAIIYAAKDGTLLTTIECGENINFKFPGFAVGSKSYAAVTTADQVYVTVLDIAKTKFTPLFRGFEPFADKDVEEDIQYEVDEMTLTADEKFLVYSNVYTNDIVFLDFVRQKKTQVIKGNPNDYIRSLRCSPDNKYLYLVKAAFVNVVDMKTRKTTEELEHTVDVVSVCTNDMKTTVTAAEDSNVRVWDRTKKVHKMSQTPGIDAFKIRLMTLHDNARYLIGFGFKTKDGDSQFLFVYDLMKNQTVRERLLDCSILQCEMLNEKELLVLHDIEHKLRVIDINTMTVTKEFQGYLPNTKWTFRVIDTRNEVACLTLSRRNVKIYDSTTGKCVAILQTGHQDKLDGLVVNEEGNVLVTWCEISGHVLIFDIVRRKLLRTLKPTGLFCSEGEIGLSPNGKLLLFKVEDVPPGADKTDTEDEIYIEVWSVEKGSRLSSLVDLEYYHKYQGNDKSGESAAADVFEILDNEKALVAHDDYIMRVFNMQTGSVLQRLTGHSTGIEIVHQMGSPYILTYGSWTEENSLRLWRKYDFSCMTSYTLDKTVTVLNWSADAKFLLATTGKPAEIVTWKLNNFDQDMTINPADYRETLQGRDLQGYIDLVPEEDILKVDPNDPDKEVASDDSDDDDDFM